MRRFPSNSIRSTIGEEAWPGAVLSVLLPWGRNRAEGNAASTQERTSRASGSDTDPVLGATDDNWQECLHAAIANIKAAPSKPNLFAPLPIPQGRLARIGFASG